MEDHKVDKSKWPRGEWTFERDLIIGACDVTGYPMMIIRGPAGSLCGYVAIHDSHPFYGLSYDSKELWDIDAHGGLTYANDHAPITSPDGFWWFGFDCAHYLDIVPELLGYDFFPRSDKSVYRNIEYVKAECQSIASQLKKHELGNSLNQARHDL